MQFNRKYVSFAALVGLIFVGVSLTVSLYLSQLLWHKQDWIYPGDFFATLRDSHMVLWGGYGILYSAGSALVAPPLGALSLTPLAFIIDKLGLIEPFPYLLARPSAWPISLFYMGLFMSFWAYCGLLFADRFVQEVRQRYLVVIASSIGAWFVLFPWGHPEDLVSLALCLIAFLRMEENKLTQASYLAGIAIGFQPLAVLFLAPLWIIRIRSIKTFVRTSLRVAFVPVLIMVPILLADPKVAITTLVHQPNFPKINHVTVLGLAALSSKASIPAGPLRITMVGIAILIGLFVRNREEFTIESWKRTFFACTAALSLRVFLEPVMVPYYVVPFAVFGMFLLPEKTKIRAFYLAVVLLLALLLEAVSSLRIETLIYTLILDMTSLVLMGVIAMGVLADSAIDVDHLRHPGHLELLLRPDPPAIDEAYQTRREGSSGESGRFGIRNASGEFAKYSSLFSDQERKR